MAKRASCTDWTDPFFNQTLVALFAVRLPDRFFESFHVNIDWGLFPHCWRGLLFLGCPVNEHVLNHTGWERFQIFSGQSVFLKNLALLRTQAVFPEGV